MVAVHWALSRQLCHLSMVDMVEAMVMGALIVEITNGSDTEMMMAMGMRPQREPQIMNPGESLITTPDRRRIRDFGRVVILMMMRKMTGSNDLSQINVTLSSREFLLGSCVLISRRFQI